MVVVEHLVKRRCQGTQLVDQVVVVRVKMELQEQLEIPHQFHHHKENPVVLVDQVVMAVAAVVVALAVLVVLDQQLREILEETVVMVSRIA